MTASLLKVKNSSKEKISQFRKSLNSGYDLNLADD